MKTIKMVIITTGLFLMLGCTSQGGAEKTIISDAGERIDKVCVVPLYAKMDGFSFGPDGKGGIDYPGFYLEKPYLFKSGGNILHGVLPSKRGIPPFIAYGKGNYSLRYFIIRKGYRPLLLDSGDIFNEEKQIILKKSSGVEADGLVDILINNAGKQQELFKAFNLTRPPYFTDEEAAEQLFIHINLTADEVALLKHCE